MREHPVRVVLIAAGFVILVVGCVVLWQSLGSYENTDDAFGDGHLMCAVCVALGVLPQEGFEGRCCGLRSALSREVSLLKAQNHRGRVCGARLHAHSVACRSYPEHQRRSVGGGEGDGLAAVLR